MEPTTLTAIAQSLASIDRTLGSLAIFFSVAVMAYFVREWIKDHPP